MSGCKLSPLGLGCSLGIFWGLSILIMGLMGHYYEYGHGFIISMGNVYQGYDFSIKGSIIGGVLAFINGFITGFIIAWLYNRCSNCKCRCCMKDEPVK